VKEPQADLTPLPRQATGVLDRALALIEFLRSNCPWDAAQTHRSLRRYLLEETHEVIDAIESADDNSLRDELGDLLLNLAFQIVIAEERAAFDREDVVHGLERKMERRHPHLHGGEAVAWERLKARERGGEEAPEDGLLSDLHPGPDPLAHARAIQARVSTVGFDWADATGAWAKVQEEVAEVRVELERRDGPALEEEIGDLLFSIVNLARLVEVHPSLALGRASAKFERRFRRLEMLASERGVAIEAAGLEELDRIWNDVKREER